jgi:hypothetical protein
VKFKLRADLSFDSQLTIDPHEHLEWVWKGSVWRLGAVITGIHRLAGCFSWYSFEP